MSVSIKDLRSVLERQGYRCALSGAPLTPDNAAPDHIVPLSQGGTNEITNIQIVTLEINAMKGALSNERFLELCSSVVATHGQRSGASSAEHEKSGSVSASGAALRLVS